MADIREFYMRSESDPKFVKDQIEVYDDLEAIISHIRMTLLTKKGEVLGQPTFGIDVESYLFEFSVDPFSLSNEATEQVEQFVPESKKRNMSITPGIYTDDRGGREVFVLSIGIEDQKNAFAVLYQ
jgi:hypothetical protein